MKESNTHDRFVDQNDSGGKRVGITSAVLGVVALLLCWPIAVLPDGWAMAVGALVLLVPVCAAGVSLLRRFGHRPVSYRAICTVMFTVLCSTFGITLLLPSRVHAFREARTQAYEVQFENHVFSVYQGFRAYADRHRGRFPRSVITVVDAGDVNNASVAELGLIDWGGELDFSRIPQNASVYVVGTEQTGENANRPVIISAVRNGRRLVCLAAGTDFPLWYTEGELSGLFKRLRGTVATQDVR